MFKFTQIFKPMELTGYGILVLLGKVVTFSKLPELMKVADFSGGQPKFCICSPNRQDTNRIRTVTKSALWAGLCDAWAGKNKAKGKINSAPPCLFRGKVGISVSWFLPVNGSLSRFPFYETNWNAKPGVQPSGLSYQFCPTLSIWKVADYEALIFQHTIMFNWTAMLDFTAISAIFYIHCCA